MFHEGLYYKLNKLYNSYYGMHSRRIDLSFMDMTDCQISNNQCETFLTGKCIRCKCFAPLSYLKSVQLYSMPSKLNSP